MLTPLGDNVGCAQDLSASTIYTNYLPIRVMVETELKTVEVGSLTLDPDNPRFYHLKLSGQDPLNDAELEKVITEDDDYFKLLDQVRGDGVIDPLWIVPSKAGKYRVIEGNMRTTVLRDLIRRDVVPPKGIAYSTVKAHVYPKDTPESVLAVQRAILQTGKKKWGRFNDAANTYYLRTVNKMTVEDIADKLGTSPSDVEGRIEDFKLYVEFSKTMKVSDPEKFSYFADAPKIIQERFFKSPEPKKQFYDLIVPNKEGITRIRTVATRGGLRDFAKVAANEKILQRFLKDKSMSVGEAYEELLDADIKLSIPVLKKLASVARGLAALSDDQIKDLRSEERIVNDVKRIQRATKRILEFGT